MLNKTKPIGFLSEKPLDKYYETQNSQSGKSLPKVLSIINTPTTLSDKPLTLKKSQPGNRLKVANWRSQAQDTKSVLFSVCMKTVFSCIPSKWFSESTQSWPTSIFDRGIQELLKINLLRNKQALKEVMFVDEKTLNKSILQELTTIAFTHIKHFVNSLSEDKRLVLTSNMDFIIRTNIEKNHRLEIKPFVSKYYPLFDLKNNTSNSKEKWVFQTYLLKELTSYPLKNHKFPIHSSDRLFFFVAQFLPEKINDPLFLNKLFEECVHPSIRNNIFNPPKESALLVLMNRLQELSVFLGEESYPVLIEKVVKYILDFRDEQEDQTSQTKELASFQREVWLKCGDLHYGAFVPLINFEKSKEGWEFLETPSFVGFKSLNEGFKTFEYRPGLTTHTDAIEILNFHLFKGQSKELATMIYKNWWFGQYRNDKQLALADRVIDWHIHALLEIKERALDGKEMIDSVENLCREKYPSLPFSRVQAEKMFFSLTRERAESYIDSLMDQIIKEQKSMTLMEVIERVKRDFCKTYPDLPFSRVRVERVYFSPKFKRLQK